MIWLRGQGSRLRRLRLPRIDDGSFALLRVAQAFLPVLVLIFSHFKNNTGKNACATWPGLILGVRAWRRGGRGGGLPGVPFIDRSLALCRVARAAIPVIPPL